MFKISYKIVSSDKKHTLFLASGYRYEFSDKRKAYNFLKEVEKKADNFINTLNHINIMVNGVYGDNFFVLKTKNIYLIERYRSIISSEFVKIRSFYCGENQNSFVFRGMLLIYDEINEILLILKESFIKRSEYQNKKKIEVIETILGTIKNDYLFFKISDSNDRYNKIPFTQHKSEAQRSL